MWIYEMLHKDFRKLGNLKEIPEMLVIDAKNPAGHPKGTTCTTK